MKRILIAGLLGAVTIFVWNAVSWMALPWHNATMAPLPNDEAIIETLRASIPATGVYAIPKLDNQRQRISGFDDFFQDALNELTNVKTCATFTEYASDVNDPARRAARDSLAALHDFVIKMRFMREESFARHFLGAIGSTVSVTLLPSPTPSPIR